jgi:hypothetical protein
VDKADAPTSDEARRMDSGEATNLGLDLISASRLKVSLVLRRLGEPRCLDGAGRSADQVMMSEVVSVRDSK